LKKNMRVLSKIQPNRVIRLIKLKHLFIVAVIAGIPLLFFVIVKTSLLSVLAVDETDEPYGIYIIAGQSNAEGTNSHLSDLPLGEQLGDHPADDEDNPDDNAQIMWRTSDGSQLEGDQDTILETMQNPQFTDMDWKQSSYNPNNLNDIGSKILNFKDLDSTEDGDGNPIEARQIYGEIGSELSIARELYDKGRRKIIILKVAFGFQSLNASTSQTVPFDWYPDVANNGQPDNPAKLKKAYRQLINSYNELTSHLDSQGKTYTVDGFFWLQGETDSLDTTYANNYEDNFDLFVNRAKEDLHLHPSAHFVARKFNMKHCFDKAWPIGGAINYCNFAYAVQVQGINLLNFLDMWDVNTTTAVPRNTARTRTVRAAIQKVADKYSWVDAVETDDHEFANDFVHLVAESQLSVGKRMINMYKLPYRADLDDPLSKRNNYDGDLLNGSPLLNSQEDVGRGEECPYMVDDVEINVAGNGNLGDDDSDCDGFPDYLDATNGPGSGMSGV
jgi:hypothetical protein